MEFAIHCLVLRIDHLECVAAITIHVTVAIGNTTVAKQEGHLVRCLWTQGNEIPKHVWILGKYLDTFEHIPDDCITFLVSTVH